VCDSRCVESAANLQTCRFIVILRAAPEAARVERHHPETRHQDAIQARHVDGRHRLSGTVHAITERGTAAFGTEMMIDGAGSETVSGHTGLRTEKMQSLP
jgi:hypothetical protein